MSSLGRPSKTKKGPANPLYNTDSQKPFPIKPNELPPFLYVLQGTEVFLPDVHIHVQFDKHY